jgi:thiol:disulfide interchange protein DsbA
MENNMNKIKVMMVLMLLVSGISNAGWVPSWLSGDDSYDVDIDYIKITPAVATASDKIEVKELFWYYCPHCFSIDDKVSAWKAKQGQDINFVRQPAVFSKRWMSGSDYFYILQDLGILEQFHKKLFDEIHIKGNELASREDFLTWLNKNGISKSQTDKFAKSFSIDVKTRQAKKNTPKYQIKGVPTFVVNGMYRVSTTEAGDQDRIFDVLDHLIEKIKKEQAIK